MSQKVKNRENNVSWRHDDIFNNAYDYDEYACFTVVTLLKWTIRIMNSVWLLYEKYLYYNNI